MRALLRCLIFTAWLVLLPACAWPEGTIESVSQYEYWDKAGMRKREVYDLKGRLRIIFNFRQNGSVEKMEKYDDAGNKVEEAFYDEKGKLKMGIDGWAAMRWFYKDFVLASQVAYDEFGHPVQRLLYSESGKLIDKQYRKDIDIDPYEAVNVATIIRRNREELAGSR